MMERDIRVSALMLSTTPVSIRVYVAEIFERLRASGIETTLFDDPAVPPACDVLWDPRTGGGRAPTAELVAARAPLVVTLHDVAHLALPWREFHVSMRDAIRGKLELRGIAREWRRGYGRLKRIIVPSVVSKAEAERYLGLPGDRITVIPHGVDHACFRAEAGAQGAAKNAEAAEPYFLHVSQYQKRKNIERLLQAYERLPKAGRPRLVMKVIGYPGPRNLPGVEFIDRQMSRDEISALYGGALGFVFPSVSEGFGMPILEAMASGCPVVTSQGTACGEVAGDAALLVDPYSVPAIAQAMQTLWQDRSARTRLRASGRAHALGFDWDASARLHAQVFRQAAGG